MILRSWEGSRSPIEVSLISRLKLTGLGRHFGVKVRYPWGLVDIYDFAPEGLRLSTREGFACACPVRVELRITNPHRVDAALCRLQAIIDSGQANRFGLLDRNCEHLARFIVEGRAQSKQLQTLAATGVLILLWRMSA